MLSSIITVMFCPAGSNPELEAKLGGGYSWAPSDHPSFFPGRQATISARGQQVRLGMWLQSSSSSLAALQAAGAG
jgi:hypothetical protein